MEGTNAGVAGTPSRGAIREHGEPGTPEASSDRGSNSTVDGSSSSGRGAPSPLNPTAGLGKAPSSPAESEHESVEVVALRKKVAGLQDRLAAANAKVGMWERFMQQMLGCVILSPDMNEMYKTECSELIRQALASVEQITEVRYVECSFPSVPSEAPRIQLERWDSLDSSEWLLKWSPSWSMQVSLEGQQYVSFRLSIRIFDFQVVGRVQLRVSPDLSSIVISFAQLPRIRMKTECAVSWGSVPLPLQNYLETVAHQEFRRWLTENMVAPNEMTISPPSFQPKQGLTDQDVEKALRAANLARQLSAALES